ncbi:heterokaryon incompatibility protein-domain-containing protein [Fusarium sp. MPI-SDFR-AT-0072]|nr:heterokaryon incompatibility protein-domain-containing protein [Fusarium sp. MPI-SDFR-AT-0072]
MESEPKRRPCVRAASTTVLFGTASNLEYEHLPRNSDYIRLIEFLPSHDLIPQFIQFRLVSYSLAEAPAYHALSYVWGNDNPSFPVSCNGSRIDVRENLHAALSYLLQSGTSRVWVDAVCINQGDSAEKAIQIKMMRNIYANATLVRIWLGPEEEGSASALRLAVSLVRRPLLQPASGDDWRSASSEFKEGLYDFVKLVKRPWFSRIWVVQEATAPRGGCVQIVCGRHSISFSDFSRAYDQVVYYYRFYPYLPGLGYHSDSMLQTYHAIQHGSSPDLLSLLLRHRNFNASFDVDKIYGLLGLASDVGEENLNISLDHNTSLDLYKDTALKMLKHNGALDSLGTPRAIDILRILCGYPGIHHIDNLLLLHGILFDEILLVGGAICDNDDMPTSTGASDSNFLLLKSLKDRYVLSGWEDIAQARSGKRYHTGENMLEAYRRTLIFGHYDPAYSGQSDFEEWDKHIRPQLWLNALYLHRMRWLYIPCLACSFTLLKYPALMFFLWLTRKYPWINLVIFFLPIPYLVVFLFIWPTRRGYIGLGPLFARKGDYVDVLDGGRVPLVLRRDGRCVHPWDYAWRGRLGTEHLRLPLFVGCAL